MCWCWMQLIDPGHEADREAMKTLIIEDSTSLCAIYRGYLEGTGLEIHTAHDMASGKELLLALAPSLVLLDIELPDGNGLDLLEVASTLPQTPAVVVMTGHGAERGEGAIERGATDFLSKPFDAARLRVTLKNAAKQQALAERAENSRSVRTKLGALHGESTTMQAVYDAIESLATSRATAFISGESGAGKELAARAIHDLSARAPEAFVTLHCATIANDQIEAELFGEVAGARIGANARAGVLQRADGGTLFLDEVCDMSFDMQSALLGFLQNGSYKPVGGDQDCTADVRVIAATNRDPLFEMREGRLREDLYYRLHVVPVRIPSLRERGDDIAQLAELFMQRYAELEQRPPPVITPDARAALCGYAWPGNVRQLENLMHRMVLMNTGSTLEASALHRAISESDSQIDTVTLSSPEHSVLPSSAEDIEPLWLTEKKAIEHAIDVCDGNVNRASGLLEVAPSTIYRKIQSWKALSDTQ